jgi:hypothetical protein
MQKSRFSSYMKEAGKSNFILTDVEEMMKDFQNHVCNLRA